MVAIMNTLAIYEQFRAVLGDEPARRFAETIGTMIEEAKNSVTKDDFRQLRESADANIARLDAALVRLAEAQAHTAERVACVEDRLTVVEDRLTSVEDRLTVVEDRLTSVEDRLTVVEDRLTGVEDRLTGVEDRLTGVEDRLTRLEEIVTRLAEAQARTEKQLEELVGIVSKLVVRSDRHEGTLLELKFRDRLPAYLGRLLRKAKVIDASDLLDVIEPRLAAVAVDDFLRADVVATGTIDGRQTYLVGEISYKADEDDVMRAARRAGSLVKAGLPATPLVACESIPPQTAEYARREGVRVWVDGTILEPEGAT
jgi:archaellum component FlaC